MRLVFSMPPGLSVERAGPLTRGRAAGRGPRGAGPEGLGQGRAGGSGLGWYPSFTFSVVTASPGGEGRPCPAPPYTCLPAPPPPSPQTRQESFSGPLCPHFTWPGCSFLPGGGQRVAVWVAPPVPQRSAWGERRLWHCGWWLWGEGAGAAGGPAAGSITVCSLVYSLSPPQVPHRTEHCSCAETCLIHRADCAFGVRSPWSRLHQSRVDAQLGRG